MPESRWPPGAMASPGARQGPATAAAIPCQPGNLVVNLELPCQPRIVWKNIIFDQSLKKSPETVVDIVPLTLAIVHHSSNPTKLHCVTAALEGYKCKDLFVFCLCVHWHVYSVECTL